MKIGEVSRMLNISIDSIRFYEKEGVLAPERKGDGAYRSYSPWDIMLLMRCARFRALGLSVQEIVHAMHHESLNYMKASIQNRLDALHRVMKRNALLDAYLSAYLDKLDALPYNVNQTWFAKRPALLYIYDATRVDGEYDMSRYHPLVPSWMGCMPFAHEMCFVPVDDVRTTQPQEVDHWGFAIETRLQPMLDVPTDDTVMRLPEALCATTILDAGELGEFSLRPIAAFVRHIEAMGHTPSGIITSNLLLRSWEGCHYHRFFEISVPLAPKSNGRK